MTDPTRRRWPWREALIVVGVFFLVVGWVQAEYRNASIGDAVVNLPIGAALATAGALALWRARR